MKANSILLGSLILACQVAVSQPTPFAGNGSIGYGGDGGAAINAQLNCISSFCGNNTGDVYISDFGNNNVRKVNMSNIISTSAGNLVPSFSGDGGPAINASLNFGSLTFSNVFNFTPLADISLDASGNLYINDSYNFRIRKVTPSGVITTIAGNGSSGYTGDGGPAIAAKIRAKCLTADASGNVYISDDTSHVVRKISTSGIITTVAGNGTAGYSGDGLNGTLAQLDHPRFLAIDGSGNLFITDLNNNRVRKVNTSTGVITTYCGNGILSYNGDGGLATLAAVAPGALAISPSTGNLVLVSYSSPGNIFNQKVNIRTVNSSGIITTVKDSSFFYMTSSSQYIQEFQSLYVDNTQNMYFSPSLNFCVGYCLPGGCFRMSLAPQSTAGIESLDMENKIAIVFPVPSKGKFTIQNNFSQNAEYQVIDINGQEVSKGIIYNYKTDIDISHQNSGTYFLVIRVNDVVVKKKMVISK